MEVALSSQRLISADSPQMLSISPRSQGSGRWAPKRAAFGRPPLASSSRSCSLGSSLVSPPFVCGSVHGDFNGLKIRLPSLKLPVVSTGRRPTRGVVTMVTNRRRKIASFPLLFRFFSYSVFFFCCICLVENFPYFFMLIYFASSE